MASITIFSDFGAPKIKSDTVSTVSHLWVCYEWRLIQLTEGGEAPWERSKVAGWPVVVQSLSHVWFLQHYGLQHARLPCSSQSPGVHSNRVHWVGDVIQHSRPLSPLLLPSIFPSIWVFSNESALHIRWPKYWSFSFCITTSNEYSGLISFRIDWFDLAV